jgi:hypothetical protein
VVAQAVREAAGDVVGLEVAGEQRDERARLLGGDRRRAQTLRDRDVLGHAIHGLQRIDRLRAPVRLGGGGDRLTGALAALRPVSATTSGSERERSERK